MVQSNKTISFAEAVDIALEFVMKKGGYNSPKIEKVTFNEETKKWEVEIDVGFVANIIKKVIIGQNGEVAGFG
ncbi:MAG: hypothetical protein CVT89_05705 [Candidatus Altiarchaeales archaeon HGW-Altiarchaeales-2]|nr:MAG: hypothetical protein CVT89_05705 [Candidatus Altiarchaeales archaeon HGW-Altiarchaeales-2]